MYISFKFAYQDGYLFLVKIWPRYNLIAVIRTRSLKKRFGAGIYVERELGCVWAELMSKGEKGHSCPHVEFM